MIVFLLTLRYTQIDKFNKKKSPIYLFPKEKEENDSNRQNYE